MKKSYVSKEKYRHELKFLCSEAELIEIGTKIKRLMNIDGHVIDHENYVVRSIYFDDYMRSSFYENESGVDPRYKYRIRNYNGMEKRINLERKRKYMGMTAKDSCIIDRNCLEKLVSGCSCLDLLGKESLLDDFIVEKTTRLLRPVVLIEYVRTPYVYPMGNVRITFDKNICASNTYDKFFSNSFSKIPVLPAGVHVLEVKYDDFLPDAIRKLVNNGRLFQSSFSKFYLGCKALGGKINYEF